MAGGTTLDAHEKPPAGIKAVYKAYQKLSTDSLKSDTDIIDFTRNSIDKAPILVRYIDRIPRDIILAACSTLRCGGRPTTDLQIQDVPVYEATEVPGIIQNLGPWSGGLLEIGLIIIPSLLPHETQQDLLSIMLHRDLADQQHKTNVHMHHRLPYEATCSESLATHEAGHLRNSFFNIPPASTKQFLPQDAAIHKPLSVTRFLNRKLRWLTLGGQYDWTSKMYPFENPSFPADLATFVHALFPKVRAEAAIVNFYTPGDTLSLHRDVSEESKTDLVSISFGCDGLFVVGLSSDEGLQVVVLRLRSGDAVVMRDKARFAWHGVPRIIPGTCPERLRDWPAILVDGNHRRFEEWRGWISNKRINLNIRQIHE
ncbi:hypothetical protein MMC21_000989 [Puttea exsequens]|nr:hypothetical protein [Puttea exsequens]